MTAICGSIIVAADEDHVQFHWQNGKDDKNTVSDVEYRSINTITRRKIIQKENFSNTKREYKMIVFQILASGNMYQAACKTLIEVQKLVTTRCISYSFIQVTLSSSGSLFAPVDGMAI